jgi:hypothetical protein
MNGKCTVSRGLEIRRRGRLAAGVWLAALICGALLVAGAPVAHAGQEGLTGRHRLADMFAIGRTETVDEQQAGRRATVSALNEGTGVWHAARHSAITARRCKGLSSVCGSPL